MRIKNATSSMLNVMMEDEDPRFKNSQFLHFLKRINQGDLVIKGQEITQVRADTENKWSTEESLIEAKPASETDMKLMEDAFEKAKD